MNSSFDEFNERQRYDMNAGGVTALKSLGPIYEK